MMDAPRSIKRYQAMRPGGCSLLASSAAEFQEFPALREAIIAEAMAGRGAGWRWRALRMGEMTALGIMTRIITRAEQRRLS